MLGCRNDKYLIPLFRFCSKKGSWERKQARSTFCLVFSLFSCPLALKYKFSVLSYIHSYCFPHKLKQVSLLDWEWFQIPEYDSLCFPSKLNITIISHFRFTHMLSPVKKRTWKKGQRVIKTVIWLTVLLVSQCSLVSP